MSRKNRRFETEKVPQDHQDEIDNEPHEAAGAEEHTLSDQGVSDTSSDAENETTTLTEIPVPSVVEEEQIGDHFFEAASSETTEQKQTDAGQETEVAEAIKTETSGVEVKNSEVVTPITASRSSGFVKAGLGGILGGAVGAAAVFLLGQSFLPNGSVPGYSSDLEKKIEQSMEGWSSRLDNLEKTVSQKPTDTAFPSDSRYDELVSRLGAFEENLKNLPQQMSSREEGTQNNIAEYISQLDALKEEINEFSTKLQGVEERIAASETVLNNLKTDVSGKSVYSNVILLVLSDRLERRVTNHMPYEDVLELLAKDSLPENDLNTLRVFAVTGVPSAKQLDDELKALLKSADEARQQKKINPDAGLLDRIISLPDRVIVSYPKSESLLDGNNPVLLLHNALERDSLAEALDAWSNLPDDYKNASTQWRERVEQIVQVRALASRIVNDMTQKIRMTSSENQ